MQTDLTIERAKVILSWFWRINFLRVFFFFLPYMGITDILLNDAEPFEQIDNTLLTEGPI